MFKALRTLFQKVFGIQKPVEAVNKTMTDANTIAQQKDLKSVAGAIAQTVQDAGDAASSVQDATK
jgi:hypothetical protein